MSDRSWASITVFWCPEEFLEQVKAFIDEGACNDWDREDTPHVLAYAEYEEITLGAGVEIAKQVVTLTKGRVVLEARQDPKYEYVGDVAFYTPDLGLYEAEADAEGVVKAAWECIEHALKMRDPAGELRKLYGRDWVEAIEAHKKGEGPDWSTVEVKSVPTPAGV